MQHSSFLAKLGPKSLLAAAARLARRALQPRTQLILLALAAFAALQVAGRVWVTHEGGDALVAVTAAIVLGKLMGSRSRFLRPARVSLRRSGRTVRRSLAARLSRQSVHFGVDLVEDVPRPRALPRLLWFALAVGPLLVTLLVVRPWGDGFAAVDFGRNWAYPVYLALLCAYWAACLCLGLVGCVGVPFIAVSLVHESFRRGDPRRHVVAKRVTIGALVLVVVLSATLPATWAIRAALLIPVVTSIPVTLVWLPRLVVLWHEPKTDRRLRCVDLRGLITAEAILFTTLPVALAMIPAHGTLDERMFDVAQFSTAARWLAALASFWISLGIALYRLQFALVAASDDPARPRKRRIALDATSESERDCAVPLLESSGWEVIDPEKPVRLRRARPDVTLRLDSKAKLGSTLLIDLAQPLPASSLHDAEVLWVLDRRAVVRRRRGILKGTEVVFRSAAAAERGLGSGFVFAPHQWFTLGLLRDVAEYDDSDGRTVEGTIRPNYRAAMTGAARHHLWTVFQALGIDLIYVEDGVGFRRVRRVLLALFQVYDRTSGTRTLLDSDLTGVHGVHAMLHDMRPDCPREDDVYPEPDFASVTRARVLHLYRDRGGGEESEPISPASDDLPVPQPVGTH